MNFGYYAITPVGTESYFGYGWNTDGILCGSLGVNDFNFFEAILNYSKTNLCLNESRIYTVPSPIPIVNLLAHTHLVTQIGFSTGGFLSNGIACRYPEVIAGVGTDAGSLSWHYKNECESMEGAVPFQSFHSLTDGYVPYDGNVGWAGQQDIDAMWRDKNGCAGTEEPYVTYSSSTSSCQRWDCKLVRSLMVDV